MDWSFWCTRNGWELGLFSPKNTMFVENLVNVYKDLMGGSDQERDRLFSVAHRTKSNGHKWKYTEFHSNIWKYLYLYYKGGQVLKHIAQKGCCSLCAWRYSKSDWTWPWVTCCCTLLVSVDLDDFKRGAFRPQLLHDSVVFGNIKPVFKSTHKFERKPNCMFEFSWAKTKCCCFYLFIYFLTCLRRNEVHQKSIDKRSHNLFYSSQFYSTIKR